MGDEGVVGANGAGANGGAAEKVKRSRPTMCLRCHVVSQFRRGDDGWNCSRCGHLYEDRYWKIKMEKQKYKEKPEEVKETLPSMWTRGLV